MPTVADYITFADAAFDLPEVAGTQNFVLNLPNNFDRSTCRRGTFPGGPQ
jgi:hypothetical protein